MSALLDALATGPAIVADLAERLGWPVRMTEAALYALQAAGRVEAFPNNAHVTTWRVNPQSNPSKEHP